MTARRIGILGGTFDPLHCGHVDIAHAAQQALGLTLIEVVPANEPPHRPHPSASAFHRFAMVALAVAGRNGWRASDIELQRAGPSYTSRTLREFHERGYAASELFFVLGADAFAEIGTWRDYPAILDAARFAVLSRPGYPVNELPRRLPQLAARMTDSPSAELSGTDRSIILIDAPTADVSSSAIRRRLAAGDSIAGLVPPAVQQHIEQHGLYSTIPSGPSASDAPPTPAAGRLHGED
jgi:nicotinate-nucleotide adenylyltransferase